MPEPLQGPPGIQLGTEAEECIVLALEPCTPSDLPNRARKAAEAILLFVYATEVGKLVKRQTFDSLINEPTVAKASRVVRRRLEALRDTANLGSHAGHRPPNDWTTEDARTIRAELNPIVHWYYQSILREEPPEHIQLLLDRDSKPKRTPRERMSLDARYLPERYRLEEILGDGGAAVVYRAFDSELDRETAIKILKEEHHDDVALVERIEREARWASSLEHRHLLLVKDVGKLRDGRPYLLMDIARGRSIADRIKAGAVDLPTAARWTEQLLDALAFIHAHDVTHRDITPSNVLLDHRDDILVTDFGIAAQHHLLTRVTRSGDRPGTAAYMAPEYLHHAEALSPKVDLYAAALVIQEALTLKPTPAGKGVPPPLGDLLRRMGDQDPDRRPTASEALAELRPHQPKIQAPTIPHDDIAAAEAAVFDTARLSDVALAERFAALTVGPDTPGNEVRSAAARAAVIEQLVRQEDERATEGRLKVALHDVRRALLFVELPAWHERLATLSEALERLHPEPTGADCRAAVIRSRKRAVELEPAAAERIERLILAELHVGDTHLAGMIAVAHAMHGMPGGLDWSFLEEANASDDWRLLCAYLADHAAARAPAGASQLAELDAAVGPAVHAALALALLRASGERRRKAVIRELGRAHTLLARTPRRWPWWEAALERHTSAVTS